MLSDSVFHAHAHTQNLPCLQIIVDHVPVLCMTYFLRKVTIICLCRNIVLIGGSLSVNSSYGQDTLGLGNTIHKLPILQNEGA